MFLRRNPLLKRITQLPFFASISIVAFTFILSTAAAAQTKLLRFPDIYAERVAFTYGGDIWTAPATGGSAIRLTAHPGMEVFAKFSPDGKWIAFTGQYDGDEQVYVIPSTGGEPRQLTFYPAKGPFTPRWGWDNQVTLEQRRLAHLLQVAARFMDAAGGAAVQR